MWYIILSSSPNWFTNSRSQMRNVHNFFNQSDFLNFMKNAKITWINNNFSNWFKIEKNRNSAKGIREIMGWTTELFTEQFVKAWKDENAKMRIQRNHFTPFVTCIKIQALESIQKLNFRLGIQTKIGVFFLKLFQVFWPTVRKNCSGDREKLWKFETEGWDH